MKGKARCPRHQWAVAHLLWQGLLKAPSEHTLAQIPIKGKFSLRRIFFSPRIFPAICFKSQKIRSESFIFNRQISSFCLSLILASSEGAEQNDNTSFFLKQERQRASLPAPCGCVDGFHEHLPRGGRWPCSSHPRVLLEEAAPGRPGVEEIRSGEGSGECRRSDLGLPTMVPHSFEISKENSRPTCCFSPLSSAHFCPTSFLSVG